MCVCCARLCMHAFENVIIDAFVQKNVWNRISMANIGVHASQITNNLSVYSTACSHYQQRTRQSPALRNCWKRKSSVTSGFPSQEPAVRKELASSIMPNTQPYRHGRYTWKITSKCKSVWIIRCNETNHGFKKHIGTSLGKISSLEKNWHIGMLSVLCNSCTF